MSGLLVEACRFRGIGASVFGLSGNDVARAVIQNNIFLAAQATSQAIFLGSATTGALIVGNDLSTITSSTPVNDATTSADTISHGNLGYPDRRTTRTITFASTTSAKNVAASDDLIWADATGGAFAVTLPAASGRLGMTVSVKKIDISTNAVTITPAGADTIDGAATFPLSVRNKYVTLASAGASNIWYVVANN